MPKRKTLINVLGAGRSGTTMLDLMLGNDHQSFSLGEVHAWFRPYRKHHYTMDCNCGVQGCPYWESILDVDESQFHAAAFEALKVNFLIDSSKNLPWVVDNNAWAKRKGIYIFNIAIHKPIDDYIYSIWKRGESIQAALKRYKLYYGRLARLALPIISVSHSDLVKDPDDVLNKICLITGQESNSSRKEFWLSESHHLFGSGGVRNQSRKGDSQLEIGQAYPAAFLDELDRVKKRTESDRQFRKIKKFLVDTDISRVSVENYSGGRQHNNQVILPSWYYLARVKSAFRRRFPEKYDAK